MSQNKNWVLSPGEDFNHKLLRYVEGSLSEPETRQLEAVIDEDPFLKDALEGLKEIQDPHSLNSSLTLLQKQLKKHIKSRENHRHHFLKPSLWLWVAALTLLIIIFIAWWQFSLLLH